MVCGFPEPRRAISAKRLVIADFAPAGDRTPCKSSRIIHAPSIGLRLRRHCIDDSELSIGLAPFLLKAKMFQSNYRAIGVYLTSKTWAVTITFACPRAAAIAHSRAASNRFCPLLQTQQPIGAVLLSINSGGRRIGFPT